MCNDSSSRLSVFHFYRHCIPDCITVVNGYFLPVHRDHHRVAVELHLTRTPLKAQRTTFQHLRRAKAVAPTSAQLRVMGNSCECVRRQTSDEAEDALLASLVGDGTDGRPRGPPPPYQVGSHGYRIVHSSSMTDTCMYMYVAA